MSTGLKTDPPPPDETDDEAEGPGWEQEGLFVRDLDGRLIRYDQPTREELDKRVTVTIDGEEIVIVKAVPATDEVGNPLLDADGLVIPRATTIYDAASQHYERLAKRKKKNDPSDVERKAGEQDEVVRWQDASAPHAEEFKRMAGDSINPIPILCHMKYMVPVAVCRVCVVQIGRLKRSTGKFQVDDKLLPACQHRVEEGMIVHTIGSPDREASARIEKAVKTLLTLLMADHPTPCAKERQIPGDCELEALATKFGVVTSPFDRRLKELPMDNSSLAIAVDHSACILCDRCIRGCNTIKNNQVLGRMGKGYEARIAFDLDVSMGSSTCVACGECMVSCPTGALTFKEAIAADWWDEESPGQRPSSRRRRWRWRDWLTFGFFQPPTRPLDRTRTDAHSTDEGAARQ